MILNILDIFKDVHGYSPKAAAYELPKNASVGRLSKYGLPLYGTDHRGGEYFLPATLGGLVLMYPLISISGKKKIVETEMTERRGSVKEIISIDDYSINIKGLIIGKHDNDFETVEAQMIALRKLFETPGAVELENALTDVVLISPGQKRDKVIIETIHFPESTGYKHIKGYDMNLVSDSVFELNYKK
jgi:hypothetical protein